VAFCLQSLAKDTPSASLPAGGNRYFSCDPGATGEHTGEAVSGGIAAWLRPILVGERNEAEGDGRRKRQQAQRLLALFKQPAPILA
jgi:hypothetical protein